MKTLKALLIIVFISSPAIAAEKNHWTDTFYQYRIPVVVDVDQAGWNIIPVDQSVITDRVNRKEELHYDPLFFGYNQVKVVELSNDGHPADPGLKAGFYLIPDSGELFTEAITGKEQIVKIPTEKGAYYLVTYTSQGGGKSPVFHYEQIFPVGSSMRNHAYMSSYEPPLLQQKLQRRECLLLSDGQPLEVKLNTGIIADVKSVSVKKVSIRFLLNASKPGTKRLMLYYQPICGHYLTIPGQRHPQMPANKARLKRIGPAEKYLCGLPTPPLNSLPTLPRRLSRQKR